MVGCGKKSVCRQKRGTVPTRIDANILLLQENVRLTQKVKVTVRNGTGLPQLPAAHGLQLGQRPTFSSAFSSYSFPCIVLSINTIFYSCSLWISIVKNTNFVLICHRKNNRSKTMYMLRSIFFILLLCQNVAVKKPSSSFFFCLLFVLVFSVVTN